MFRSVMNLVGAERDTLVGRQRHDFIDDLESFFWVYAWVMTVHNGPGMRKLVPESEQNMQTRFWETAIDPSYHAWKRFYLRDDDDPEFENFTPYFSKEVYLTLFHDLRSLLHSYCDQKVRRRRGSNGIRLEIDLFDEMDEIYSKMLGSFDTAINTLSPPPKLPTRLQPDRQAKRPRNEDQIMPLPNAKRARITEPRPEPAVTAIRPIAPSKIRSVRRSERLKSGKRTVLRQPSTR